MSALKVDTFIDVTKAVNDTAIDEIRLREEIIRQSGLVYYYTSQYAKAVRQASRLKLFLEVKESKTAQEIRKEAAESGTKLTVDQVKDAVRVNKEVNSAELALIEAREVEDILKGIVTAMRDKSSNLITLTTLDRDAHRVRNMVETDLAPEDTSAVREKAARYRERLAS